MVAILAIATVVDIGIAGLLVAVSGFILEGVNNTGPMSGAAVFVAFVLFAVAAPIAAWVLRAIGYGPRVTLSLGLAPIVIGALALLLEPVLAPA